MLNDRGERELEAPRSCVGKNRSEGQDSQVLTAQQWSSHPGERQARAGLAQWDPGASPHSPVMRYSNGKVIIEEKRHQIFKRCPSVGLIKYRLVGYAVMLRLGSAHKPPPSLACCQVGKHAKLSHLPPQRSLSPSTPPALWLRTPV